ncbi:p-hydroxycinnamoyl-CoA synthetase [Subtercola boreus]|uniref:p-hydroxycinnamoyl-CoA synthetase n=1 Tax=Subtercola boreus TaxID=120213 RepID=A0A3E0VHX3_9MICO|nr:long-chain fatty acid--CoA ligase [Subtercola boreus]RFA09103.1 p-hydroxycinnamoyl-CoA synthetase [Subtercola boreus]TQL53890.1 fatty-acyl-CoA synthase [Subtercola boreus]
MKNQGVGSWIHRRRVKSAGADALIHRGHATTYDELAERVDAFAVALMDRGLAPGDRVAYLGNNHPAFLETLFACGVAGLIFVPLNTRLAPVELAHCINDSGATVLVVAGSLESLAVSALYLCGPVTSIVVDEGSTPNQTEVEHLENAEQFESVLAQPSKFHPDLEVGLDDPAMIIYTSGTTGRPKGALLTHGNITWNTYNVLVDYDITSTERALMVAPLFHVAALGMGCFSTLLKGGTVIIEEKFDPGRALVLVRDERITLLSGVPTTFQLMCEHPAWNEADLSSLRSLTCGGSAVPARVLDAFEVRGLSFSQGYGMTETAPGATSLQPRFSRSKAGSVGLPHFFTDIRIADGDGRALDVGGRGEIQVSGPNAVPGYWNRPEDSAALYTSDGWLHTGDAGYVDADGFLYIADRMKDMIISGGENIYSAEVENAILELEEVTAAAVIGLPDDRWGEVPHAVLVIVEGVTFDRDRFDAHLRERLARYKIPKTLEVVDELPRTASGKVQKNKLRITMGHRR